MIQGTIKQFIEDVLDIAGYTKKEKEEYLASLEDVLQEAIAIELLKKFSVDDARIFAEFITKHKSNPQLLQEFFRSLSTKEEFIETSNKKIEVYTLEFLETFLLSANGRQKQRIKDLVNRYRISRNKTRTLSP